MRTVYSVSDNYKGPLVYATSLLGYTKYFKFNYNLWFGYTSLGFYSIYELYVLSLGRSYPNACVSQIGLTGK